MNENIKDGKVEVMGINIDISQVLGQKIVDQYIAQLRDEDVETLMKYISEDLFTKTYSGDIEIKQRKRDSWGGYVENNIPIGELIKNQFNSRIKEELSKKVEEIIASADYQTKVEEIANELVEYSINGYKEDIKNRIRERLIGNVMDGSPQYCGVPLTVLINEEIDKRLHY